MSIEIISAGAGSGKTYSLTDRMFKLLDQAQMTPPKILALTYLKKAAGELKERVSAKLIENKRADLALQMQSARIGTVHSVCAEFLSQFAFELGESPDLQPIEEVTAERLFEEALNITFKELKNDRILKVLSQLGDSESISDLKANVRKAASLARKNCLSNADLQSSKEDSLVVAKNIFRGGVAILPRLEKAITDYIKQNPSCASTVKKTIGAHEQIEKLSQLLENRPLNLAEMLKGLSVEPGKKDEAAFVEFNSIAADLPFSEEYKKVTIEYIEMYFDTVSSVIDTYQKIKIEKGYIDFEDMEVKMLNLLGIPSVVDRLKEEIDLLLVDEFQDTPPIQLAIFKKLTEICKEVIWVGDAKQSILGFTGADPILMKSLVGSIQSQKGGKITPLLDNYRSAPNLVEFSNQVFTDTLAKDGFDPKDIPLNAKRNYKTNVNFEAWLTKSSKKEERSKSLAKGILELLQSGMKVTDKLSKVERPICGADIAVLYRGNKDCYELAQNLKEIGVKTSLVLSDFISTPEVSFLLACYSYAIDHRNTIAAAEAALDFGKSATEIEATFKKITAKSDIKEWSPIIEKLQKFHFQVKDKSPSFIVDEVIDKLDIINFVSHFEDVEQKVSNIHLIQDLAKSYEQSCFDSMTSASQVGFVRFLKEISEQEKEASAKNSVDAVNVLTMHKSKGLEWAVVVLGNINEGGGREFNIFENHIVQRKAFNPEKPLENRRLQFLPWIFAGKKTAPDAFATAVLNEAQKMPAFSSFEAEQRRLLYVALTRAREIMIFGMGKENVISERGHLHCLRDSAGNYAFSLDDKNNEIKTSTKSYKANFKSFDFNEDDWKKLRPKTSVSQVNVINRKSTTLSDRKSYILNPSQMPDDYKNTGIQLVLANPPVNIHGGLKTTGVKVGDDIFGSFFHQVVASTCSAGLTGNSSLQTIESLISSWGFADNVKAADIETTNLRFFTWVNSFNPESVETEVPILVPIENESGNQWIRGQMDMIIHCKEKIVIIDHKTSSLETDKLQDYSKKYFDQLSLYANAMKYYSDKKVEAWLYYPVAGACVKCE